MKTLVEHDQMQLPFNGEFEMLMNKIIWQNHASKLKSAQKAAHLDFEDLQQEARLALFERQDELDGVTDRYKRGKVAITIMNAAIGKMLTANAFLRTSRPTELVPIAAISDIGDGDPGGIDTYDIAVSQTEDHADAAIWRVAFTKLTERSQTIIVLRQAGLTWVEIADYFNLTDASVIGTLERDLARHGLLEYFHEIVDLSVTQKRLVDTDLPPFARGRSHKKRWSPAWKTNPDRFIWDETKTCDVCGVEFPRDKTVNDERWALVRFCGWNCSNDAVRLDRNETKVCVGCGTEFAWGDHESRKQWDRRKYCTLQCAALCRASTPSDDSATPKECEHVS